ncbi:MAG: energy-coupling factor transporter ATPase [Candidatus Zixiibacteriota bacterium]
MIRLENVTYRYRDDARPVLRNLSLEIQPGEVIAIMGPNGSGKSTLARLLTGLVETRQGHVHVDISTETPMPVGLLFQNPDNQMVAVTVEKEIAFALENQAAPVDEMERRITATLEQFGITHLRQRLTSELSGGEKQRVALAAVMICRPPMLVLDEPDSFLDEPGKAMLLDELGRLQRENPAMIQIHITQYPSTAQKYRRLIVLDRGAVAFDGPPQDIFADNQLSTRLGVTLPVGDRRQVAMPPGPNKSDVQAAELAAIEVRRASFDYADSAPVVRNVSFSVRRGETLGVVGSSGSGKSTLGLLLSGLLRPQSGSVDYLAADGTPVAPERCTGLVTAVFQQPERQFFLPTCSEEITFGPKNVGLALAKHQVAGYLALVGLEPTEFSRKDPYTLSGGEKRRLAFAAVLSMAPQFVVFDEPTCGLDLEGVGRFIHLVQSLRWRGAGLTIITHDGDLVNRLCDQVLYLQNDGGWDLMSRNEFFGTQRWEGIVSPPMHPANPTGD